MVPQEIQLESIIEKLKQMLANQAVEIAALTIAVENISQKMNDAEQQVKDLLALVPTSLSEGESVVF